MAEFFRGWKRKVGVATLVVACTLAGAWMRSWHTTDYVMIAASGRQYELFSIGGRILECSHRLDPEDDGTTVWLNESKNDLSIRVIYLVAKSYPNVTVQYWSILAPFTVLSAWLLLSKPRREHEPATA